MNPRKGLVLDANILLRAVLGIRVRRILEAYEDVAAFYCPDVCFAEAEKYIPDLARRRGLDLRLALSVLEQVSRIVDLVDKFSAIPSLAQGTRRSFPHHGHPRSRHGSPLQRVVRFTVA